MLFALGFTHWTYSNEPTVLLVAAVFLRVNRWWGNTISFALAGYLVGSFLYLLLQMEDPVAGLRGDWRLIRMDYPYIVGSWDSQYLVALIILCCSVSYLTRAILRRHTLHRTADNKTLGRCPVTAQSEEIEANEVRSPNHMYTHLLHRKRNGR